MTGSRNDSKLKVGLAVVLAAVMVISMLGMGFVGSAAAVTDSDEDAFIASNPADDDASSDVEHVVTVELTAGDELVGSSFGNSEESEIEVDYGDDDAIGNDGDPEEVALVRDGEVKETLGGTIENDNNPLTIEDIDGATDEVELEAGDFIRVYLDDNDFDNSEIDADPVTVTIEDDKVDGVEETFDAEVPLGEDAAIEDLDENEFFTSFTEAVESDGGDNDVQFTGASGAVDGETEFDEFLTQPTEVDSGGLETAAVGGEDVVINTDGDIDPVVISSADTVLDANSHDGLEVDNIAFDADGELDTAGTAIDDLDDATITNSEFDNFDSVVLDAGTVNTDGTLAIGDEEAGNTFDDIDGTIINVGDTDSSPDLELQDNTVESATIESGELVDISGDGSLESVDIEGEDYTFTGDGTAISVDVEESDLGTDFDITDVDISSTDTDGTAIALENFDEDGVDLTISGVNEDGIEGVETGIDLTELDNSGGEVDQTVDISEVEFTDLGGTAIDLSDVAESDNTDQSVTLDVSDIVVNGADTGIDFSAAIAENDNDGDLVLDLDDGEGASEFRNIGEEAVFFAPDVSDAGSASVDLGTSTFTEHTFDGVGSGLVIDVSADNTELESTETITVGVDEITLDEDSEGHAIKVDTEGLDNLDIDGVSVESENEEITDATAIEVADDSAAVTFDVYTEDADIQHVATGLDINADSVETEGADDDVYDASDEGAPNFANIGTDLDSDAAVSLTLEQSELDLTGLDVEDSEDAVAFELESDVDLTVEDGNEFTNVGSGLEMTGNDPVTLDDELVVSLAGDLEGDSSGEDGSGVLHEGNADLTLNEAPDISGDLDDNDRTTTGITVDITTGTFDVDDGVDQDLEMSGLDNGLVIEDLGDFDGTSAEDRELQGLSFTDMGDGTALDVSTELGIDATGDDALVVFDLEVTSEDGETTAVSFDSASSEDLVVVNSDLGSDTGLDTGVTVEHVDSEAQIGGVTIELSSASEGVGVLAGDETTAVVDDVDDIPSTQDITEIDLTEGDTLQISGDNEGIGVDANDGTFDFSEFEESITITDVATGILVENSGELDSSSSVDGLELVVAGTGVQVDDTGSALTLDGLTIDAVEGEEEVTGIEFDSDDDLTINGIDLGQDEQLETGISYTGDSDVDFGTDAVSIDASDTGITVDGDAGSTTVDLDEADITVDNADTGVEVLAADGFESEDAAPDELEFNDIGETAALKLDADTGEPVELHDAFDATFDGDGTGISVEDNTDVDVRDAVIDGAETGIEIADSGATLTFDDETQEADDADDAGTTIENVDSGIVISEGDLDGFDMDDVDGDTPVSEFDAVDETVIELTTGDISDPTVSNVEVTDSGDATAVAYDMDDDTDLTVQDSDFLDVESGITTDGSEAAQVLTIHDVEIDNAAGDVAGTGIEADLDTTDGELNVDDDVEIRSVDTGIELANHESDSAPTIDVAVIEAGDVGVDVDEPGIDGETVTIQTDILGVEEDVTAISFDNDGSDGLSVDSESQLGTEANPVAVGVNVEDAGGEVTVNGETAIHLEDSSDAVGVDTESGFDGDLTVEGVTIDGDGDGTAVSVDIGSGDFTFDDSEASTIADVEDGIVVAEADSFTAISDTGEETTFDGLSGTAFDLSAADADDPGIDDVELLDAEDTTFLVFEDDDSDLTVENVDVDGAVESFVTVEEVSDAVTVTGFDNTDGDSDVLELTTGDGIVIDDVDPDSSEKLEVEIQDISAIEGVDTESTAGTALQYVLAGDDDSIDFTGGHEAIDTISNVDEGLVVNVDEIEDESDVALSDFVAEGEIDGYAEVGASITVDDGTTGTLTVDDATLTEADDASEDATGLLVNASDADLDIQHNEFDGEANDGDGIAIDLADFNDGNGDDEIHFNDITGFDHGLAGDAVEDLDREDAVANYWGDGGPLSEDGSTVDVTLTGVAEDAADNAAIYDPYLTADTDTVADNNDVDASELELGVGIQEVGQDLQVQSSGQTIAFPAQTDGSLADAFVDVEPEADVEEDGVKVWEYNAETDEYELVDADEEQPNFDAYVSTLEDEDSVQAINVDYDNSQGAPGAYSYEEGFNLVPITQATDSDLEDVTRAATFGLDSEDDVTITGSPTPALGSIYAHDSDFGNYDASEIDDVDSELAPYHGVWIAIEDEDADAADSVYTGPTDGTITLEQILDGSLEDEHSG